MPVIGGFSGDGDQETVNAFRADLQGIYGSKIAWGNSTVVAKPSGDGITNTYVPSPPPSETATARQNGGVVMKVSSLLLAAPFLFA